MNFLDPVCPQGREGRREGREGKREGFANGHWSSAIALVFSGKSISISEEKRKRGGQTAQRNC